MEIQKELDFKGLRLELLQADIDKEDFPRERFRAIYYGNENLKAQQGLFTLWQVKKKIEFKDGGKVVDMETKVNRNPLDQLLLNLRIKQGK